jgi:DNA-binding response OmpR family regulator
MLRQRQAPGLPRAGLAVSAHSARGAVAVHEGQRHPDGRPGEQPQACAVKTAGTGYDAGLMTEQFKPHLILLDYMLPDINGNLVCERIKSNPDLADTKIIIMSGVVNQDEISDLRSSGADDFVKKPFNIEQLIQRMAELVEV